MNWNPDLAADCDLLFAGWWVCVGVKPESSFSFYFPTGPVSLPETTPWTSTSLRRPSSFSATPTDSDDDLPSTVTAMPTSLVQANTTKDCRAWYQVNEWETCKDVVDLFGTFSLKDFTAWNPTVGDDCAMIQVRIPPCLFFGLSLLTPSRTISFTAWPCLAPRPTEQRLLPPRSSQRPFLASLGWRQIATAGGE